MTVTETLNTCFDKLNVYCLYCSWYKKEFDSIDELINDCIMSGMDSNYEITLNGSPTGELLIDLIQL